MITEDIDITWKLYQKSWDVEYEPSALVYIFVPEKLTMLFKQRKRWSRGGMEVTRKNLGFTIRERSPLFFLLADNILCVVWTISFCINLIYSCIHRETLTALIIWFTLAGVFLTILNFLQILTSLVFEKKYEKKAFKFIYLSSLFSLFYWLLQYVATVPSIPYLFKKISNEKATWDSPDRGRDVS